MVVSERICIGPSQTGFPYHFDDAGRPPGSVAAPCGTASRALRGYKII
jgi:hypothetical protein